MRQNEEKWQQTLLELRQECEEPPFQRVEWNVDAMDRVIEMYEAMRLYYREHRESLAEQQLYFDEQWLDRCLSEYEELYPERHKPPDFHTEMQRMFQKHYENLEKQEQYFGEKIMQQFEAYRIYKKRQHEIAQAQQEAEYQRHQRYQQELNYFKHLLKKGEFKKLVEYINQQPEDSKKWQQEITQAQQEAEYQRHQRYQQDLNHFKQLLEQGEFKKLVDYINQQPQDSEPQQHSEEKQLDSKKKRSKKRHHSKEQHPSQQQQQQPSEEQKHSKKRPGSKERHPSQQQQQQPSEEQKHSKKRPGSKERHPSQQQQPSEEQKHSKKRPGSKERHPSQQQQPSEEQKHSKKRPGSKERHPSQQQQPSEEQKHSKKQPGSKERHPSQQQQQQPSEEEQQEQPSEQQEQPSKQQEQPSEQQQSKQQKKLHFSRQKHLSLQRVSSSLEIFPDLVHDLFSINPYQGTIAPGQKQTFHVLFSPECAGKFETTLLCRIPNLKPTQKKARVILKGRAQERKSPDEPKLSALQQTEKGQGLKKHVHWKPTPE
ncbi:involucrin-like [Corvus moneduloides]|uniref:involucrin-like n=1 Tax=Corvus moneduloides TaxID=1196302 RepID=UPI001364270E|nr:involucrin-like [Corvus moneduloides]